jgi:hypothetical protein
MKKLILLTLVSAFSLSLMAQDDDDMYFVPTKENVAKETRKYGMPQNTYYSGSNRSVDDYNRRMQFSYPVDSTGNDIIDFSAVRGVYPDSIAASVSENDDYKLTRQMSRFDDYMPSEAYWDGYRAGRWSSPWYNSWYSWYDPWYYDSWWYWNDPFYYTSWHYGWRYPYYYSTWYSPRYYSYYGWYSGRLYGGYRGASGRSWSRAGVTHHKRSSAQRGTDLGGYRSSNSRNNLSTRSSNNNSNLGGYRSSSSSGSFGGNRSGGFSSGGGSSHSSGGGRSAGGGHSYGGRR